MQLPQTNRLSKHVVCLPSYYRLSFTYYFATVYTQHHENLQCLLLTTYCWTVKHSFTYCYVGPQFRVLFSILVSCYDKRPLNKVAYTKNEAHYFPTRQSTACMQIQGGSPIGFTWPSRLLQLSAFPSQQIRGKRQHNTTKSIL